MTEKTKQPVILDFDPNHHAVIEPDHDQEPFHFHSRLLYAFVPKNEIDAFLDQHLHRTIGEFESVSFSPKIYEVELNGEYFTLCQAPLGGPASVQLLDWLISYGVNQVLTVGNAGALTDLPENEMLLVKRAIRDEGTSFHYMEQGQFIDLNQNFLKQVEDASLAACAQFRKVDFTQILFTADTLADIENYDERDWGYESHSAGLEIGSKVLTKLGKDE